jgi:hypothetical protein
VKRPGRGELIGAVIHICMEITQGNSLCSCLYLKLATGEWNMAGTSRRREMAGKGVGG